MKIDWYVYSEGVVKGPYSTETVKNGLNNNIWEDTGHIWRKGQTNWISLLEWKLKLPQILESLKEKTTKSIWYIEYLEKQMGPFQFDELQKYIASNRISQSCKLWTTGMDKWTSLYEIPEVVEFLGITRRKHSRAPIKGEITIQTKDTEYHVPVGSISEGGLGFIDQNIFKPGDEVRINLKSPMLVTNIRSHAKVVYTQNNGFAGIEFLDLTDEAKSTIIGFVKQFKTDSQILAVA